MKANHSIVWMTDVKHQRQSKKKEKKVWTPERDAELCQLWPRHRVKEVAALMGLSDKTVSSRAKRLKLKKDEDFRGFWSDDDIQKLKEIYPDNLNRDVAAQMGKRETQIVMKANHLGLKKSEKFWKETNSKPNGGRFQKEHTSWNKGMKGLMLSDGRTCFKPGHLPHNTKRDSEISLRFDNDGRPILYFRVALSKWIPYAHKVFADFYGEVPKGMVIRHRNNNRFDFRLENLECITKYENRIRNSASTLLSDNYVASTLLNRTIQGEEREEWKKIFLKNPELIEAKRSLLKLKKEIKNELSEQ